MAKIRLFISLFLVDIKVPTLKMVSNRTLSRLQLTVQLSTKYLSREKNLTIILRIFVVTWNPNCDNYFLNKNTNVLSN